MTDQNLLTLIEKTVKDAVKSEVRPLKEQVEIVKDKISKLDLFQNLATENIRTIKEQQSVINEKLGDLREDLNSVKQLQENSIYPSVLQIESAIKAYADMYKINNSNSKKLDKRLGVVEDTLDIHPPPEFSLAEVS